MLLLVLRTNQLPDRPELRYGHLHHLLEVILSGHRPHSLASYPREKSIGSVSVLQSGEDGARPRKNIYGILLVCFRVHR